MPKLGVEDDEDQSQQVLDPNDDTDESAQAPPAEDPTVPRVVEASDEDERLATSDEGESDDDDVAPQQNTRRKESAKERRERARRAKEADKQTIELLTKTVAKQNEAVEKLRKEFSVKRVTDLDERISTAIAEADQFDGIFYKAIKTNPEDARQAAKLRDEAKQRAWQLDGEKQKILAEANQPRQQQEVPYKDKALRFLSDKKWYNPGSGDEDSLVVEALDKALTKTMNPNSDEYWDTLESKVREKLPHRFESQDDQDEGGVDSPQPKPRSQARKGPPTGGSSRSTGGGNQREIALPKEMVEAMKEAGHWDDPKVRARVAQRYVDGVRARQRG